MYVSKRVAFSKLSEWAMETNSSKTVTVAENNRDYSTRH